MASPEERPARLRRPPLWPLLPLLALAAVSVFLHVEKSRRQGEVRKTRERYDRLVEERPIAATKAQRARFYQARYYLEYPAAVSFAVSDFIRRLNGVFRPGEMLGLQIDPGVHDLSFRLTVGIGNGAGGAALWRFAGLYEKLRAFPEIIQASFIEKDRADGGPVSMFTISGQAELQ